MMLYSISTTENKGDATLQRIYLDYNASTPIASEVAQVMTPFLSDYYGNPSTTHWAGKTASQAYTLAKKQVADLLGCDPEEVIFTSGGSEANNHALKGVFWALKEKGNHIITTQVEHPAIINPCKFLEKLGAKVTYVGVDRFGQVSPSDIEEALTLETILISVMHANNEVGTIQPITDIAKIAKKYNVLVHTDAAQTVGKIPTKVDDLGVDLLSLAGHKLYAPKGIGALYIRKGTPIEPLVHGAGHEGGRRAGTENILLSIGLGKAGELAAKSIGDTKTEKLRDYFWDKLKMCFAERIVLNGHPQERLPNTLSVSFIGKVGQDILESIPELAASTGSACHSGIVHLSPVLKAMNVEEHVGKGTIRFSLGRYTIKEEIDDAILLLQERI